MVNKKGFVKILEAVIAIILIFIFITLIIPRKAQEQATIPREITAAQTRIIDGIQSDETLRQKIFNNNDNTLQDFINSNIQQNMGVHFIICQINSPCIPASDIPPTKEAVYTKSLVIADNYAGNPPKLFKLYLWRKT